MSLTDIHTRFLETEYSAHIKDWELYCAKPVKTLIAEKELFIAKLWSVDENAGFVVLRCKIGETPRIQTPYYLGLTGREAQGPPQQWRFTYKEFRNKEKGYWSGKGAEAFIHRLWKVTDTHAYFICTIQDLNLFNVLHKILNEEKKQPLALLAENDPPLQYLQNLIKYTREETQNPILQMDLRKDEGQSKPKGLDNSRDVTEELLSILSRQKKVALQGPPGTGKSYYAANVADRYLQKGYAVAACALSNKALMELAKQPGLKQAVKSGKVSKSNLSVNELKELPGLKPLAEIEEPAKGGLNLLTYYSMSEYAQMLIHKGHRFDLLIVEEASQAFLATIAMFDEIAENLLIIGDHKQLPPVVVARQAQLQKIDTHITGIIEGFRTYFINKNEASYRLLKTRRLTKAGAALTGIFYDNQLQSTSEIRVAHPASVAAVFEPGGGVSVAKIKPVGRWQMSVPQIMEAIAAITLTLTQETPEAAISILSPRVEYEKLLSAAVFKRTGNNKNIVVTTIHKAQGMTSDYTICYLPLKNTPVELGDNLFNVATSRAERGTLIVTYDQVMLSSSASPQVIGFLSKAADVTEQFVEHFKQKGTNG